MVLQFELKPLKSLEQIERFLAGSAKAEVDFPGRKACYRQIARTLQRSRYEALGTPQRCLLRCYLGRATACSRRS